VTINAVVKDCKMSQDIKKDNIPFLTETKKLLLSI
jgi:hypothetical protein